MDGTEGNETSFSQVTERMLVVKVKMTCTEWNRCPELIDWKNEFHSCQKLAPDAPNSSIRPLSITCNVIRSHTIRHGRTIPWLIVKSMYHLLLSKNSNLVMKREFTIGDMLDMMAKRIPRALMTTGNNFILRFKNSPSVCWWKGSTYRLSKRTMHPICKICKKLLAYIENPQAHTMYPNWLHVLNAIIFLMSFWTRADDAASRAVRAPMNAMKQRMAGAYSRIMEHL